MNIRVPSAVSEILHTNAAFDEFLHRLATNLKKTSSTIKPQIRQYYYLELFISFHTI